MKNIITILFIVGLFSVSNVYSGNNFQEPKKNKTKQKTEKQDNKSQKKENPSSKTDTTTASKPSQSSKIKKITPKKIN